jgi:anti-sigma B factor antagonist
MKMRIDVRREGPVVILEVTGEVRIGEAANLLRATSRDLLDAGSRQFVFDLRRVPWLDSSGLGEVFACYKRARERQGDVKLVLAGKPCSLFTITQLDRIFEIFDNPDDAVASFPAR